MSKIGLLFLSVFLFLNTSCQNFFWSHECCQCEEDTASTAYGYLYNYWAFTGDPNGDGTSETNLANTGWHVPTRDDFLTLIQYYDPVATIISDNTVGAVLKDTGTVYWDPPNTGATNVSKFDGRGGGYRGGTNGVFVSFLEKADYATTTLNFSETRFAFGELFFNDDRFNISAFHVKPTGVSVRLVKDSTTLSHGQTGTYTGNDGTVYPTICIGTQEWMSRNLEETLYRDGSGIDFVGNEAGDDATWAALETGAYCIFPIP